MKRWNSCRPQQSEIYNDDELLEKKLGLTYDLEQDENGVATSVSLIIIYQLSLWCQW